MLLCIILLQNEQCKGLSTLVVGGGKNKHLNHIVAKGSWTGLYTCHSKNVFPYGVWWGSNTTKFDPFM